MKQSIILWLGAFVVAFLFVFWNRFSSPEYPITGSFGINMKSVTFKFDKVYRGNDSYKITIKSDNDSLNGRILWRIKGSSSGWNAEPMNFSGKMLTGEIPHQPPSTLINYRVKVWKGENVYYLPQTGEITLKYLGKVPPSIIGFYFSTLYLALFFSVRTGLDYFNDNQKIKKLSLFTVMLWIANVMIFNPVKRSYELSARIGSTILPVTELFDFRHLLLLIIWITGIVIIFNLRNYKIWAGITAGAILIAFLFL